MSLYMPISKVTSKYQTTIPMEVRKALGLSVSDTLRWELRDGMAVVVSAKPRFLERRGSIEVGPGDSVRDVRQVRRTRGIPD